MSRPTMTSLLRTILAKKIEGQLTHTEFCAQIEHAYNFETAPDEISKEEEKVFSDLFDVAAWFTADHDARAEAPTHFKDEAAVDAAIRRAKEKLDRLDSSTSNT